MNTELWQFVILLLVLQLLAPVACLIVM